MSLLGERFSTHTRMYGSFLNKVKMDRFGRFGIKNGICEDLKGEKFEYKAYYISAHYA